MITDWFKLPFFSTHKHDEVLRRILAKHGNNYLPAEHLYTALMCPRSPEKTKVLILGQDPYPTPGHAHGLAFSVRKRVKPIPRSLQNIFKEMVDDLGCDYPEDGSLIHWADQGVLLLNTCLTVSPFQANSHKGMGWEELAKEVVHTLSAQTERRVFIFWGRQAQAYANLVNEDKHLIISSPHPSPLSASYGFFGSKPFSRANEYLDKPIQWGNRGSESPEPTW